MIKEVSIDDDDDDVPMDPAITGAPPIQSSSTGQQEIPLSSFTYFDEQTMRSLQLLMTSQGLNLSSSDPVRFLSRYLINNQ
jgi:hypothetical protein